MLGFAGGWIPYHSQDDAMNRGMMPFLPFGESG
jgi:hypothetical protein